METYWEVELGQHAFITSARDGTERSVSCSGRFSSGKRVLGTNWI